MTEFHKGDVVDVRLNVRAVGNSNICVHHDTNSTAIWVDKKNCTLISRRKIEVGDCVTMFNDNKVKGSVLAKHNNVCWVLWVEWKSPETYHVNNLQLADD